MISQGAVSLRAARQDCGLSAAGSMRPIEFKERTGQGNPSLASLRGTIACRSSKQTTGSFGWNVNPGTACRTNWSEANIYNVNDYLSSARLETPTDVTGCSPGDEYDALVGYSFVGTLPAGNFKVDANFTCSTGYVSYEVIVWSSGYFAGTPTYLISWNAGSGSYNWTDNLSCPSGYPYLTVCIQALQPDQRYTSKMKVNSVRAYR